MVLQSRDFASVEAYTDFVGSIRDRLNSGTPTTMTCRERALLRRCQPRGCPSTARTRRRASLEHDSLQPTRLLGSSRLIGCEVEVRQYPDVVEVWYRRKLTETMPRLRGDQYHRIDNRHVIWSLVRKPGAFARYIYREELFPRWCSEGPTTPCTTRAGREPTSTTSASLHLAASTMQDTSRRARAAPAARRAS